MRKKKGSRAEEIVWEAIKQSFENRECLAYWNYPIFSSDYTYRHEPDILLLDRGLGTIVIEVKGISIGNIVAIQGHRWIYQDFYEAEGNPYEQAENQMNHLAKWLEEDGFAGKLTKRVVVALPYITRKEWEDKRFHRLPSNPPILFQEDLEERGRLLVLLAGASLARAKSPLLEGEWNSLLQKVHGGKVTSEEEASTVGANYSLLYIAASEEQLLVHKRQFLRMLEKGIKVVVFSAFEREEAWFPQTAYGPFEEAFLFQYVEADAPYRLEEPIIVHDGIGVDEEFADKWFTKFSRFNDGQYMAEHAPANANLAISAGAGTGKTAVMIQRIMFLLATVPELSLKEIVMITFTRDAAQEMKQRLKDELLLRYEVTRNPAYLSYAEELREMMVSTIDSFAKILIQELGFVLGFGRDVQLKGYVMERREIIEAVLDEYVGARSLDEVGLDNIPHHQLIRMIETFWNEMEKKGLSEEEIRALRWKETESEDREQSLLDELFAYVLPRCEEQFNVLKVRENAITIGDLVRKMSEISDKRSEILKELPFSVHTLFVDEFQDSDDVQIRLVAEMNRVAGANVFVVGDIKQSIYRFRGADYTAFKALKTALEGKRFLDVSLDINYRTSETLLKQLEPYFVA